MLFNRLLVTTHPELLRQITDAFFVDNWLGSFKERGPAVRMARLLIEALAHAGFNLTQFASSRRDILDELGKNERVGNAIVLEPENDNVERTLGLVWLYQTDCFRIQVP